MKKAILALSMLMGIGNAFGMEQPAINLDKYNIFNYIKESDIGNIQNHFNQGFDPNVQDAFGNTPLHEAVKANQNFIVELLLERQVDPDIQDLDGHTPLHLAVIKNNPTIVEQLVAANAQAGIKNMEKKTALDLAKAYNVKNLSILESETARLQGESEEDLQTKNANIIRLLGPVTHIAPPTPEPVIPSTPWYKKPKIVIPAAIATGAAGIYAYKKLR